MIYYFLLIAASLAFGSQFMAVKAYEKTNGQTIGASARFSAFYGMFAFVIFFCASGCRLSWSAFSSVLAVLLACVGVTCNMVGLKTLSMGDIAVYSLFMMLGGMMVPFVYGVLFLHEKIGVWNIVGLILLVSALVLPVFDKKKQKGRVLFYLLCIALFFLNGLSSTFAKVHQVDGRGVSSSEFTAMLFGVQSVFGFCIWLITACMQKSRRGKAEIGSAPLTGADLQTGGNCRTEREVPPESNATEGGENTVDERKKERKRRWITTLLCALAFAVLNGSGTFMQVVSAKHVAATAQFPIITGGTLVFSAVLGRLIYREKFTKLKIAQIAVAFAATILFIL